MKIKKELKSADAIYIEWYHIIDGKLNAWYQTKGDFTFSE